MVADFQPYAGSKRRIVLSFDIGMTFSGVSYCYLDPGESPKICCVTRYPGQEQAAGSNKIPTVLLYDNDGEMRAAGAEADLDENAENVDSGEWNRVEWFKVRMHPNSLPPKLQYALPPPLPSGKTIIDIYADFMRYLFHCAKSFIIQSHAYGSIEGLFDDPIFIFAHPNAWAGPQQTKMRQAAVMAELVPESQEGHARIKFVTEGEASLHYCIRQGIAEENRPDSFIIADLGGATLDFNAYKVKQCQPLQVEEIAESRCELEGSTFVSSRAKIFLRDKLKGSRFGSEECIQQIARAFDEKSKKTFRSSDDNCRILFGSPRDNEPEFEITAGKLKLSGQDVAGLFEPSLEAAIDAIKFQKEASATTVKSVYFVGGFSSSSYLTKEIQKRLEDDGISFLFPDGQTSKAVADGAISFYLDNFVISRVATASVCIIANVPFNRDNPEHMKREAQKVLSVDGKSYQIKKALSTVIEKGTSLSEDTEYTMPLLKRIKVDSSAIKSGLTLHVYGGPNDKDSRQFLDMINIGNTEHLQKLCTVKADFTSKLASSTPIVAEGTDEIYYSLLVRLVLAFGGTEWRAHLAWNENGVEKRGPAEIIYDEGLV